MKRKLLIIGAGGHGKVVADVALNMKKWEQIAFLDDGKCSQHVMGIEVIGVVSDAVKYIEECDLFVAIGNNSTRANIQELLEDAGASLPILIHPNAIIGEEVELAPGTVVMAGAVINCCTKIGKGCIINTGATVDHDNYISDFVHISPGAHTAGNVIIGHGTWLGIGSIVSNNVTVVSNCTIGAAALVIKDLEEEGTYIGVPARRI
jgi:sugar O-acyltransferase (sialic acid O-acetyltransferase NeuD family)